MVSDPEQHESGIHGQIARLARRLHGTASTVGLQDPQAVLDEVTRSAVEVLPGVDHAGITLVQRPGKGDRRAALISTAETGEIPGLVDTLQHETDEGPCFEAIWQHSTIRLDDIRADQRWPRFCAAVADQTPVRSALSIQLFVTDAELGALNLYANESYAFDDPAAEDLATNLATHAAIAVSSARRGEQFRSALASRDIIGQAKGILMERYTIDSLAAFDLLRKLSQESNTPLAVIADRLVTVEHPPSHTS